MVWPRFIVDRDKYLVTHTVPITEQHDPYAHMTQIVILENACSKAIVSYHNMKKGLTQQQVFSLAKCWNLPVQSRESRTTTTFMADLHLSFSQQIPIVVHYDRIVTHEQGGGHYSPIVALGSASFYGTETPVFEHL